MSDLPLARLTCKTCGGVLMRAEGTGPWVHEDDEIVVTTAPFSVTERGADHDPLMTVIDVHGRDSDSGVVV